MSGNIHAGVGAGKNRQPWRIREFLASLDLDMAKVGRELGVSRNTVRTTVYGTANNRKVLAHLSKLGCPDEILSPPKRMR